MNQTIIESPKISYFETMLKRYVASGLPKKPHRFSV